jgi:hypothetical protein
MSDLGSIGVVIPGAVRVVNYSFGRFSSAVITGSGATAGAQIVVLLRSAPVAIARADSLGVWTVDGLDDGEYWASEIGTVRGWLVTVAGATVTVVEQDPPDSGDVITAGSSFGWIG